MTITKQSWVEGFRWAGAPEYLAKLAVSTNCSYRVLEERKTFPLGIFIRFEVTAPPANVDAFFSTLYQSIHQYNEG